MFVNIKATVATKVSGILFVYRALSRRLVKRVVNVGTSRKCVNIEFSSSERYINPICKTSSHLQTYCDRQVRVLAYFTAATTFLRVKCDDQMSRRSWLGLGIFVVQPAPALHFCGCEMLTICRKCIVHAHSTGTGQVPLLLCFIQISRCL